MSGQPSLPVAPESTVHEACLGSGADGSVLFGAELTEDQAVQRLQAGGDIVVRGDRRGATRHKAGQLAAAAFGDVEEEKAHRSRGRVQALDHFHPLTRSPEVHAFFEDAGHKARRMKA